MLSGTMMELFSMSKMELNAKRRQIGRFSSHVGRSPQSEQHTHITFGNVLILIIRLSPHFFAMNPRIVLWFLLCVALTVSSVTADSNDFLEATEDVVDDTNDQLDDLSDDIDDLRDVIDRQDRKDKRNFRKIDQRLEDVSNVEIEFNNRLRIV